MTQKNSVFWLYVKSEFLSFPLTCHHTLLPGHLSCSQSGEKIQQTNMDFLSSQLPVWVVLPGKDSNKGNKSICYLHISKASLQNPFPHSGMRSPWWCWHHRAGRDSPQRSAALTGQYFLYRSALYQQSRE